VSNFLSIFTVLKCKLYNKQYPVSIVSSWSWSANFTINGIVSPYCLHSPEVQTVQGRIPTPLSVFKIFKCKLFTKQYPLSLVSSCSWSANCTVESIHSPYYLHAPEVQTVHYTVSTLLSIFMLLKCKLYSREYPLSLVSSCSWSANCTIESINSP
jgi:hypothetical protein